MVDFRNPKADKSILLDVGKRMRTQTLFWETSLPERRDKYPPLYTLAREDRHGLPSAYNIYISSTDETDAAMRLVGSLLHWNRLLALSWFREGDGRFEGVKQWREEMRARDLSLAKRVLIAAATDGDIGAAKKLYDENKPSKTRTASESKSRRTSRPVDDSTHKIAQLYDRIKK